MSGALARLIVRASAVLVPTDLRQRWRREWLGELASDGRPHALRRALGAPRDAWLSRWTMRPRGAWWRTGWRADVRDAWRSLRRTPLQTLTIVVCLTIGGTVTVLMYGVINTLFGGPMAGVRDQGRLVRLFVVREQQGFSNGVPAGLTVSEFRRLPEMLPGMAAYGAEREVPVSVAIDSAAVAPLATFVSGGYFTTMGTQAAAGRVLGPPDDSIGAAPVAVVGFTFARRHFGDEAGAIGALVRVGSIDHTVVGVLPKGFVGLEVRELGGASERGRTGVWAPLAFAPGAVPAARGALPRNPRIVARLAPHVALGQAQRDAQDLRAHLDGPTPLRVELRPFQLADVRDPLGAASLIALLMASPFLVLMVACANVAGIQLARSLARRHELAVRVSLGATRLRVVRMLLVETALPAAVAAALSFGITAQLLRLSADVLPFAVFVDTNVFIFCVLLPAGVTVLAGLLPAWRGSGVDLQSGLSAGTRVGRPAGTRLRRTLVAAQIALSAALLMATAVLSRSFDALADALAPSADLFSVDLGFAAPRARDREHLARQSFTERMAAVPGVADLAVSSNAGQCWPGEQASTPARSASMIAATTGYFPLRRLEILAGRLPSGAADTGVVVNRSFVSLLPPGTSPLGTLVWARFADDTLAQRRPIVGVVSDYPERIVFRDPSARCFVTAGARDPGPFTVYARSGSPADLERTIRRLAADAEPPLGIRRMGNARTLMEEQFAVLLLLAKGLAGVSALALLMAAIGLFGVTTYGVAQRTAEFGVRLALGARPGSLVRQVGRDALLVTILGALIGVALVTPLSHLYTNEILPTVSPLDPFALLFVAGVLALAAIGAASIPAWRVGRIDPVRALRAE